MPFLKLLELGQIWTPAVPGTPSRRITGRSGAVVRFRSEPADADDTEHGVPQSSFRRWIREHAATPAGTEASGRSPAIELAKKITTLRKASRLTQGDLAQKLGLSRSAVAAMETGRLSSAHNTLPRLAEVFGVPVSLFLDGMAEQRVERSLTADESALLDLYRALSPEDKIGAQKYIERRTPSAV